MSNPVAPSVRSGVRAASHSAVLPLAVCAVFNHEPASACVSSLSFVCSISLHAALNNPKSVFDDSVYFLAWAIAVASVAVHDVPQLLTSDCFLNGLSAHLVSSMVLYPLRPPHFLSIHYDPPGVPPTTRTADATAPPSQRHKKSLPESHSHHIAISPPEPYPSDFQTPSYSDLVLPAPFPIGQRL
ncbi:hypothetical protein C8F04DRAFT_1258952 [Mycena alexandri]|uniref:Uncharacterized protein n=1 Tax=Mycena alexandri TaxID=1745969 RepID=A0AAD6X4M9_9AGAR|nr:hypothetical protein C8F04DRAFT_1258952 [Mycena alexandri]